MSVSSTGPSFTGNPLPAAKNAAGNGLRETVKNVKNYVPTASHDKLVQVSLKPLLPLILAASALTYHEGQQKRLSEEGNGKASSSWPAIIAESTLGCLLLKHTAGVYPLLGLAIAIGRASKENNALDQLKAVISTAVTMGMGFLGANLLDSELMEKLDNKKIKNLLETKGEPGTKLGEWMKSLVGHENEHLKTLGRDLGGLKAAYLELTRLKSDKDAEHTVAIQKELEKINQFKAQIAEKLDQAMELPKEEMSTVHKQALKLADSHGAKDTAQSLMKHIAEDQSGITQITRVANPVCCFMFSAFLLGAPLANWINGHLEHSRPDLKKKAMKQVLFPESQRVLKPSEGGGHHGGEHSYAVNPGPYISCPDIGDGRPMQ